MDKNLTGTTITRQSGPDSDGDEKILNIHQSSRTAISPSDCLMPYP